jgi:hypothetical protein
MITRISLCRDGVGRGLVLRRLLQLQSFRRVKHEVDPIATFAGEAAAGASMAHSFAPFVNVFESISHRAFSRPIQNSKLLIFDIKSCRNLALFISRLKFPEQNVELVIWLMGREADVKVTRKNHSVASLPLPLSLHILAYRSELSGANFSRKHVRPLIVAGIGHQMGYYNHQRFVSGAFVAKMDDRKMAPIINSHALQRGRKTIFCNHKPCFMEVKIFDSAVVANGDKFVRGGCCCWRRRLLVWMLKLERIAIPSQEQASTYIDMVNFETSYKSAASILILPAKPVSLWWGL